jgi:signal transduction histidine kinase
MADPEKEPVPGIRGLLDVAHALLDDLDLEVVLERVLRSARDLVGARFAALGVLGQSRMELERFITSGIDDADRRRIGPLPRGRGVLGELIGDPVPLRLSDVGAHPHSYGFPAAHPVMRTFLGVPVMIAGRPYGNLYLAEKAGGELFSAADEEAVVLLAEFAGVAIDHARHFTGLKSQRSDLHRTIETLEATVQIARAVGGETDLGAALVLIAKRGRALVDARAVFIAEPRGDDLVVSAGAGELPPGFVGRRIVVRDSVIAIALSTGTVRLEDELIRAPAGSGGLGAEGLDWQAGLAVPLRVHGRARGVVVAVDRIRDGPAFGEQDREVLEALATSAATAVATAEIVHGDRRRLRLAAAEQERSRWARELNDRTLQSLASLRLALAAQLRAGRPQMTAALVTEVVDALDGELAALRALISELRPVALDELGLAAACEDLAVRARREGVDAQVAVDPGVAGPRGRAHVAGELETALYRIAEDALAAGLDRGAQRVRIDIRESGDSVRVTIRDDGRPLPDGAPTSPPEMIGVRERSEAHGGTVEIASAPGQGTTVIAALPARPAREPGQR